MRSERLFRRQIRKFAKLKYFITICTKEKICYFERYPELKKIVFEQWYCLPKRFSSIGLDEFIIMPNHLHGIIVIMGAHGRSIGSMVGAYKSLCVVEWLKTIKTNHLQAVGTFWQRNYYEHVIRDENDLNRIRRYILENPMKWDEDENNPRNWKE